MTANEVMSELKAFGDEQTKKTYIRHGAREPLFGVKVADLKRSLKKPKRTIHYLWNCIIRAIQMPCIWQD
jgi:hypothetical protein